MPILDQLNYYLTIFAIIFSIVMVISGVAYYFYKRGRKKRKLNEDHVDYSYFNRHDSVDYIKIDDIKDNMIILDNNTCFVGGIKCQGYDIYSAQLEEQASTAKNFMGFINTIKSPITYRQYSKNIDLECTISNYTAAHKRVEEKLYNVIEDIKDIKSVIDNSTMDESEINTYRKTLKDLENQKTALENREFHLRDEIAQCEMYNGNRVQPELRETYFFDWTYSPFDFPVELSEKEIYERALQELEKKENMYRHALASCSVKARRCTTEELIEMNRSYSSPLSADRFRLRDVLNSSYFTDIVTSNSVQELVDLAKQKVDDDFMDSFTEEMKESVQNMQSLPTQSVNQQKENIASKQEQHKPKLKKRTTNSVQSENL